MSNDANQLGIILEYKNNTEINKQQIEIKQHQLLVFSTANFEGHSH